ncbi:MAG: hypothetical protein ACKOSQ_11265 [Planctomycetaceae bacterium]
MPATWSDQGYGASPFVNGDTVIVCADHRGSGALAAFDRRTGDVVWKRIFTSGGYPRNHVSAVRADGSATFDWENGGREYVPSMIFHEGHLYGVLDAGRYYPEHDVVYVE